MAFITQVLWGTLTDTAVPVNYRPVAADGLCTLKVYRRTVQEDAAILRQYQPGLTANQLKVFPCAVDRHFPGAFPAGFPH
jgi:hypothetical protein